MKKLNKYFFIMMCILFAYLIGIQLYQYYTLKANAIIHIVNNCMVDLSIHPVVEYKLYLDGELIKEGSKEYAIIPEEDGMKFYLKPGKHILTVKWVNQNIKEEFVFYSFLLVQHMDIWFTDIDVMDNENSPKHSIGFTKWHTIFFPYTLIA